jgi:hypothetical protein
MVGKKKILWATVVVIAAGGTAIWRHRRHQHDAAKTTQVKTHKHDHEEESPPPPKKEPKSTVLSPAAKEQLAEQAFIAALRSVFIWRSTQPDTPKTSKALLEKFAAIACEQIPQTSKAAWQSLLQSWQSLGDPAKAADPQLKAQGQRAADTLNAMLKAHGEGDILF